MRSDFAEFRELVALPGESFNPIEAAFLIAMDEYPKLSAARCGRLMAEMKNEAEEHMRSLQGRSAKRAKGPEVIAQVEHFNKLFFETWGFHGNNDEYYDPRNSFLNDVIDRRTGIPISLTLLYVDIARGGAAIEVIPVGMPGHFLAGFNAREDLYIDVFGQGAFLTLPECAKRAESIIPELIFEPGHMYRVGPRVIVARMLRNLINIYINEENFPKALHSIEMILCVEGETPEWMRQRGLIFAATQNYGRAVNDLERYLECAPNAPDRYVMVDHLRALQKKRATVN
ncbi:MAG: tetratricopeptide repeat protein [Candidatus Acidiferrales bacterium]